MADHYAVIFGYSYECIFENAPKAPLVIAKPIKAVLWWAFCPKHNSILAIIRGSDATATGNISR